MAVDLRQHRPSLRKDLRDLLVEQLGEQRVEALLQRLSTPPNVTFVRVNLSKGSREEIKVLLEELDHALRPWREELSRSGREAPMAQSHAFLDDLLYIEHVHPHRHRLQSVDEAGATLLDLTAPTQDLSVVVDQRCGMAVLRGADIFVRGVLLAAAGVEKGSVVRVFADIKGEALRGSSLEEYKRGEHSCVFLGWGESQVGRSQFFSMKEGLGVKMSERIIPDAPPLNGVLPGKIYVQNLPSAIVSRVLHPSPHELVVDLCAAPGGKTTHLAQMMNGEGVLVAVDRTMSKAVKLRETASAFGLSEEFIKVVAADSARILISKERRLQMQTFGSPAKGGDERNSATPFLSRETRRALVLESLSTMNDKGVYTSPKFPPEVFDKVLLDPPCSALGLRPRLILETRAKELRNACKQQRNLLFTAVYILRPGGHLCYSTCTISATENEEMVKYILEAFPCMELLDVSSTGGVSSVGIESGLSTDQTAKVLRFDPCANDGFIGFFTALFRKTESILKAEVRKEERTGATRLASERNKEEQPGRTLETDVSHASKRCKTADG